VDHIVVEDEATGKRHPVPFDNSEQIAEHFRIIGKDGLDLWGVRKGTSNEN
jgi:hypothetical protein